MFYGLYWSARKESRSECISRFLCVLHVLASRNDFFCQWYRKGSKVSKTAKRIDLTHEDLSELFTQNRRDHIDTVIEELGFSAALWNGMDGFATSVSITCGAYTSVVKNNLVLQLPDRFLVSQYCSEKSLIEIFESLIQCVEADFAVVTSNNYLNRKGGGTPWELGGWLNYNKSYSSKIDVRDDLISLD